MTEVKDKIEVRDAVADDMSSVLELINELAVYENAADQVTNTLDGLVEDGFGEKPVFNCIVALQDKTIIGFALFYTSYSTWKGPCLYLEDFLVTKEWRRKGIGKLLFDKVHTIAKNRKVKRFVWQVLDWNKPAINFYHKYNAVLDETWINCKLIIDKE